MASKASGPPPVHWRQHTERRAIWADGGPAALARMRPTALTALLMQRRFFCWYCACAGPVPGRLLAWAGR